MDVREVLDSAASGWWYPVVVIALVIAGGVWKAFHFDPDRPGETVLPPWLLTSGALLAALPIVARLLVDGEMGEATFGLCVVVGLAGMSLATTFRQQAATSRRAPRR